MLDISSTGDFSKTDSWLSHMSSGSIFSVLNTQAERGVSALQAATPEATGVSANSWGYEVSKEGGAYRIQWTNSHVDETGTPIVILLQYGHGTGTGGYVQGRDFINPAIAPIFQEIADSVWKEVSS